ncbi:MAG: aminopeptidase P N-terminal domain-containing protein [Clostridia bacterium]|nr:aminopeptidase P N-terminal domain-containing protein [Clostridia bacterium]
MDKKFYRGNRRRLLASLPEGKCMAIFSSGYSVTRSADETYDFQVNANFYYLTGITQAQVHLVLLKDGDSFCERLYIDPYDEFYAKWIGHRLTREEASALSGVAKSSVHYRPEYETEIAALAKEYATVYLDLEKAPTVNYNSFGLSEAERLGEDSAITVADVYPYVIRLRSAKQKCEVEALEEAIRVTGLGVDALMKNCRAGMYEYQLEAYFDHTIKHEGNRKHSFKTIAASGVRATTLHYSENNCLLEDGELILFDLGCRYEEYCADITRTFPINGRFSPLQRTVYEIVLNANKTVARRARAGMTLAELQAICVKCLTDGCLKAGLIEHPEDIKKYYFHGVSHSIGLDTHDPCERKEPLPVGAVISNEPGLYFPQHNIGIRIEDDLLLLKTKAVNLSAHIIKEVDEIEAFMANAKK